MSFTSQPQHIEPTPPSQSATESTPTSDTNKQITGAASSGEKVTIKNMTELKEKAPEVYKLMMQGIAMNICHEAKESTERIKEMLRKARERDGG